MKSHLLIKLLLGLVLTSGLLACSRPYSLSNLPAAAAVPYQLKLEFSSALNELYYVFSGPAFTYGRFPVNARLSTLLREQTQRQSSPTATSLVVLKVYVEELTTNFEEIGLNRSEPPVHVAMAGAMKRGAGPILVANNFDGQGGDSALPEATHKTARMKILLRLERTGQLLGEKKLEVEQIESHYWYDEYSVIDDYYRYNYGPVFDAIYRKVLAETAIFVEQTLGV